MHVPNSTSSSPLLSPEDATAVLSLRDEAATLALGAALAPTLHPGLVITLEGDLGAGKTTLVRGLLRALGYGNKVKSPTYTLVEVHVVSGLNLYHFDFYRFNEPEEYLDAGLDEYFQASGPNAGVCLVEWPDKAGAYLPRPDLRICLSVDGQDGNAGRKAVLHAPTARGAACLTSLSSASSNPVR
ncbi:MAG: tRNA (adenosine(37)-N6)-threonylcarbamoyltransferase complex ATPase subunit type 1 TsaE [Rhodocyclaceae bacterium]|nr:tRNA (adenosine(37)-N6)-threonylcarbamoyltransferase complex ATPase subunit type 1 TsaE [Rhodocyclaceae bacterium]